MKKNIIGLLKELFIKWRQAQKEKREAAKKLRASQKETEAAKAEALYHKKALEDARILNLVKTGKDLQTLTK